MQPVTTDSHAPRLAPAALDLLDVQPEPATSLAGELLDRICEHLSSQLLRADSASLQQQLWQAGYLSIPRATVAARRTSQQRLRSAILDGHLPGNRASIEQAAGQVGRVAARAVGAPKLVQECLLELEAALRRYHRASTRLRSRMALPQADLAQCAEAALRLERTFVSELEAIADRFR